MTMSAFGAVEIEESTPNHWVGGVGDVVLMFLYEGSHDDVGHVLATRRRVESAHRRTGKRVKLMCVLPPLHGKPPSSEVRAAIAEAARGSAASCDRVSVVILGTGFAGAIHRSATTGILALIRLDVLVKVHDGFDASLAFLLGADHPARSAVQSLCASRV